MHTLRTALAIMFLFLIYVGGAWLLSRFFTPVDFSSMSTNETATIVLIPLGMSAFILCEHLFFPRRTFRYPEYHGRSIAPLILLFGLLVFTLNNHSVPYWALLALVFSYGALLYVLLSEMLLIGLARSLTKSRGENWPKELDYIYLAFGAFGLANALNRMDAVTQNMVFPTFLSTALLATALVLRLIKTRAEVNDWNKSDKMPEDPFAEPKPQEG